LDKKVPRKVLYHEQNQYREIMDSFPYKWVPETNEKLSFDFHRRH
jgi:hypothetical protein